MNVHLFEMNEIEFSCYLLNMRDNILIEPDIELRVKDIIILAETCNQTGKKKGRKLSYRTLEIDKTHGMINDKIVWNVLLRKLVNYNELKERIERIANKKKTFDQV